MVGVATRFVIARQVHDALASAGAPEAGLIDAESPWYYLGVLGPSIGDFVPSEPPETIGGAGRTGYYGIWKEVLRIAVGDTATGTPGVVPVLRTFREFLDKVSALVAAQDFGAMVDLRDSGELDAVKQAGEDLGKILQTFSDPAQLKSIGDLMGTRSKPRILNPAQVTPPGVWTGREWLHWKKPGAFARELRDRAAASGDNRFRAYALGWTVAYAALTTGSGFMNSVVGSSYRNHWWRSRWIANFVDTWAWGFYGASATMSGDTPNPPYANWPGLCNARLHDMIDLTGGLDAEAVSRQIVVDDPLPQVLPGDFVDYWLDAWQAAYSPSGPPLFTANRLQAGYLLSWITLWFQTSGDVVGCNTRPSLTPPDACGDDPQPPDWVDPTQTNPVTGSPFVPPSPNAEHDPDIAEIVSGAILAIAGLVSLFFGGGILGVAAIAGGIALMVDGVKQLNWDELECQLYWIRIYLYNGLAALHKITVFGGLQHPYPADLAVDMLVVEFNGGQLSYMSGPVTCKSRGMEGLAMPWSGLVSTWTFYPTGKPEEPYSNVWQLGGLWPSAIVDDAGANPAQWDIQQDPPAYDSNHVGSFGPAVPAALNLVAPGTNFPDWNLDGDRGLGWLTWELTAPYGSPVMTDKES